MEQLPASTVVLFFLVLPGILIREGWKRGGLEILRWNLWPEDPKKRFHVEWLPRQDGVADGPKLIQRDRPDDYPKNRRPLIEEILQSLFWAVVCHTAWIYLSFLIGYRADFALVGRFLFGKIGDFDLASLAAKFHLVLAYFISLYLASYCAARLGLMIVRECKLDLNIMFFRLRDNWFYLLRGDFCNFRERLWKDEQYRQILATTCTVALEDAPGSWAYSGKLAEYLFDNDGALEYLVLEFPVRIPVPGPTLSTQGAAGTRAPKEKRPAESKIPSPKEFALDGEFALVSVRDSKYVLLEYLVLESVEFEKAHLLHRPNPETPKQFKSRLGQKGPGLAG